MFIRVFVGLELRPSVLVAPGAFLLLWCKKRLSCRVSESTGDWRLATFYLLRTSLMHIHANEASPNGKPYSVMDKSLPADKAMEKIGSSKFL